MILAEIFACVAVVAGFVGLVLIVAEFFVERSFKMGKVRPESPVIPIICVEKARDSWVAGLREAHVKKDWKEVQIMIAKIELFNFRA